MDARLPVRAFFTDRHGGVSPAPFDALNLAEHVGDDPMAVAANRSIVEHTAGGPVVFMRPEHGAQVAVLGDEYLAGSTAPVADVLVTTVAGVGLATLAADCVPLLIHDGLSGAVAAAHIGREGLSKGVVDAAFAALVDIRGGGLHLERVSASIGPAICGSCYEVSASMQASVAILHPTAVARTRRGSHSLDLPGAVATRLAHLGLTHIVEHGGCTFEDSTLFSYRRDQVTGRQAGVIVCEAGE